MARSSAIGFVLEHFAVLPRVVDDLLRLQLRRRWTAIARGPLLHHQQYQVRVSNFVHIVIPVWRMLNQLIVDDKHMSISALTSCSRWNFPCSRTHAGRSCPRPAYSARTNETPYGMASVDSCCNASRTCRLRRKGMERFSKYSIT